MSALAEDLFEKHRSTLEGALKAIAERTYWSAYPETPSEAVYGENGKSEGEAAFQRCLNASFPLDQPCGAETVGKELSPYGFPLGVRYPKIDLDRTIAAAREALRSWRQVVPRERVGVALEALTRLNARSFEMAFAVMHTTGQGFAMAFQAGGPHAQDRALEAIAYAYREMTFVPETVRWEKPQGKRPPIRLEKRFRIVPRGVGLTIGCSTFPTWNAYPGLFANFVTGNPTIVKPHPGAILPLALTVRVLREVLAERGYDPNVVQLAADESDAPITEQLAQRPEIAIIDYTGSSAFGEKLETEARHAVVFTEKAGINTVIFDSTDDLDAAMRNIAFSLSLYSGQMCTAPQNIYVPQDGVLVGGQRVPFEKVTDALVGAIGGLLSDDARAVEILGAIQNETTLRRLEALQAEGNVLLASRSVRDERYPQARVRTPLLLTVDGMDNACEREQFGPIAFIVPTKDARDGIERAASLAQERGAITGAIYSTDEAVLDRAREAAEDAGIALSCNLSGNIYVNQSTAFSDFHVSGLNPAGNAVLVDAAFVAPRFHVVASRMPIAE